MIELADAIALALGLAIGFAFGYMTAKLRYLEKSKGGN